MTARLLCAFGFLPVPDLVVLIEDLGHIGSALIRQLPFDFSDAAIVMVDNMMTQRYASLFDLPVVGRYLVPRVRAERG